MNEALARWTSRKVWICIFWEAVFVGLLLHKDIPPEIFLSLTMFNMGSYYASNVMAKYADGKVTSIETKVAV